MWCWDLASAPALSTVSLGFISHSFIHTQIYVEMYEHLSTYHVCRDDLARGILLSPMDDTLFEEKDCT